MGREDKGTHSSQLAHRSLLSLFLLALPLEHHIWVKNLVLTLSTVDGEAPCREQSPFTRNVCFRSGSFGPLPYTTD